MPVTYTIAELLHITLEVVSVETIWFDYPALIGGLKVPDQFIFPLSAQIIEDGVVILYVKKNIFISFLIMTMS